MDSGRQKLSCAATIRTTIRPRASLRVTPDTLRWWKEAGINPFLEACAQLKNTSGATPDTTI